MATAILLLTCPDQRGLVAAVAGFVAEHRGNIVHAEQHTDATTARFFQRVEFELDGFDLPRERIAGAFAPLAARHRMVAEVRFSDHRTRTAVLVSRQPHCLVDLLARWHAGELPIEIPLVISNHPDHAELCAFYGVQFHHLPVSPATKELQEERIDALLAAQGIELVVLARYMQILSDGFCARWHGRVINIHHSFLPAFVGAKPYHQAHARGVKLIGVTAHYATADLDEGPIIAQDVVHVTHRDSPDDLVRKGRDLEVTVLAGAVRAHAEHRVLVDGNKTVVFS